MSYRFGALIFCLAAALVVAQAQVPVQNPIELQPNDASPLLQAPELGVPPGVAIPIDVQPVTLQPVGVPVTIIPVPVETPSVEVPAAINLVWRTNPECLGPASDLASFLLQSDLTEEDNATTCAPFNSTYSGNLEYHIAAMDNSSTCNTTGANYYNLFLNDECTGIPIATVFNTSCSPFISASITKKQNGAQEIPSASQQFSCDESSVNLAPYVQIIGPGCSQAGVNDYWTVTWSNQVGNCVKVYNVSSLSTAFDYEVSYAKIENVCEAGATEYSVTLYDDDTCSGTAKGNMTFADGCNLNSFNVTCFNGAANPNAPQGAPSGIPPSIAPADINPSNPFFQTPEYTNPEGDVVIPTIPTPADAPVNSPSGAASVAASSVLIGAAAALAYLL